jgi:hypothetical protein|tara:strand:+ start:8549 stop:9625 length:1077 start_codon:yes stop_codon:yes gene_type:complete
MANTTTLTVDPEKRKRSEEESAKKAGYDTVDDWKDARRKKTYDEGIEAGQWDSHEEADDYMEWRKGINQEIRDIQAGHAYEHGVGKARERELRNQLAAGETRQQAKRMAWSDPELVKKRRELEERTKLRAMYRTPEEEAAARRATSFEREARRNAQQQRDSIAGRARALGLTPAQMEALNQGLQRTDAEFERQIKQARIDEAESAKEELAAFKQAAVEQGGQALMNQERLRLEREQAAASRSSSLWGSILSGVATLGAAALPLLIGSDERIKSDIDRGKTKNAAYDFLENLDVAQYNMPGANAPEMGVMAQSMEKSPLGQQAVTEIEGVKSVDVPQAFKSLIVAQKEMHDRIKRLEKK